MSQKNNRTFSFDIVFSTPAPESLDKLHSIADSFLDGYSLYEGRGAWKGISEHSYLIRVILPKSEGWKAYDLAKEYKRVYDQEAVLVASSPVNTILV